MTARRMLSIDPGLDLTAVALWDLDRYDAEGGLQDVGRALRSLGLVHEIPTEPRDGLQERLRRLHWGVEAIVGDERPTIAYVEVPSYRGSYSGGKERRAGVNKLYMAIGAVMAGLGPTPTIELPAITMAKKDRHTLLEVGAQCAGIDLPSGPRGGQREDAWDALWLGCRALTTRLGSDLAELTTMTEEDR